MAMEASLPGPSRRRSKTSSGKRPLAINASFKSGWFELYMWSSVSVSESAAWASLFLEPCFSLDSYPILSRMARPTSWWQASTIDRPGLRIRR